MCIKLGHLILYTATPCTLLYQGHCPHFWTVVLRSENVRSVPPYVTFMHKDNLIINDILKYLKQSLTIIMTAIFLVLNLNSHDHGCL